MKDLMITCIYIVSYYGENHAICVVTLKKKEFFFKKSQKLYVVRGLPCWQIAPWTMVTESKTVNSSSSVSVWNRFVTCDRNTMRNVNPKNVKNVTIQTSNLNGKTQILRTLDNGGCLNKTAGLKINRIKIFFPNVLKKLLKTLFRRTIHKKNPIKSIQDQDRGRTDKINDKFVPDRTVFFQLTENKNLGLTDIEKKSKF